MRKRTLRKLMANPNAKICLTPIGKIVAMGELALREQENKQEVKSI